MNYKIIIGDMMNDKGQALVEYVLIIAMVTLIIFGAVKLFGGYLMDKITEASCGLADKVYVEGENPGEGTCQEKTLE